MVLVDALALLHTTQDLDGDEILHDTYQDLQDDEDVGDETENTVRGGKASMIALVDLDDDESGDEAEETEGLDDVMDDGSEALLVRGGGGLKDESGLDLKQEGSGVEELMRN